jgi:hypothetical protein
VLIMFVGVIEELDIIGLESRTKAKKVSLKDDATIESIVARRCVRVAAVRLERRSKVRQSRR